MQPEVFEFDIFSRENQIRNLENERHGDESAGLEPLIHELMEKMEDFHRQIDDLREEVRRLKR